jgi:RNA polymerase sigma-70 factor (ECF subfamily)
MAETMLPHDSEGSASRPLVGGPTLAVDWSARLAEHDRWLRTVVFARLGERPAVDEVMQEVALAAVAQQAPLSDLTRLGAWLYRIAVRQALLYRRRRGRQRKLVDSYAWFQERNSALSSLPDPLDLLLRDERQALVRESLGRLPSRDREILLLKYTEDWSYRELAGHLGVSESAIEARLHRARQRLREAMISKHLIEADT